MRKSHERGMSILEVMIVLTLLTVVFGAAFMVQSRVSRASTQISSSTTALRSHMDTLNALRNEFSQAKVLSIAPDGSSVTYSLPIFDPTTGSALDATGSVIWGINPGSGPIVGGSCTVSFSKIRNRSEYSENLDINGDGDKVDNFDEGRLNKVASTGVSMGIPRTTLLLKTGGYGGDVDSDGVPDPLFSLVGAKLVAFRMVRPRDSGELLARQVTMAFLAAP